VAEKGEGEEVKEAQMMQIGVSKESVEATRAAMLDILKSGQEQKTIREALRAFTKVTRVSHVTVQNCTFTQGKP
jgi:hypothetical protein